MKQKIVISVISFLAVVVLALFFIRKNKEEEPVDEVLNNDINPVLPLSSPNCEGHYARLKNKRFKTPEEMNWKGADWGSYATAIKVDIAGSTSDDVDAYNEYFPQVTAFFYAHDLEMSGRNTRAFKNDIQEFIDENLGTTKSDWTKGELRCDFKLSA